MQRRKQPWEFVLATAVGCGGKGNDIYPHAISQHCQEAVCQAKADICSVTETRCQLVGRCRPKGVMLPRGPACDRVQLSLPVLCCPSSLSGAGLLWEVPQRCTQGGPPTVGHSWLSVFLRAGKEMETEQPLKQILDTPENGVQLICARSAGMREAGDPASEERGRRSREGKSFSPLSWHHCPFALCTNRKQSALSLPMRGHWPLSPSTPQAPSWRARLKK